MKIFSNLFKKKKVEKEIEENKGIELTDLEKFCEKDPEVYDALKDTMFLDPRKIEFSLKDAISKAKYLEKVKDYVGAAALYKIAGGLAIYEGNVSKVKEYFGKYAEITGKNLKILEIPEKAVEKAQEYYRKYLKKEVLPS